MTKIAIVGTAGIPANYGGFETLAENLVVHFQKLFPSLEVEVHCSSVSSDDCSLSHFNGAKLIYTNVSPNGPLSVVYDFVSLIKAISGRADVILILGVSSGLVLPFVRFLSKAKLIVNIDGIEWRRAKWSPFAKWFLRLSESLAIRACHEIVVDNQAISDYVYSQFNKSGRLIAYGGDHALIEGKPMTMDDVAEQFPGFGIESLANYYLKICRIEPENNVDMILRTFAEMQEPLVIIGNWESSSFGRKLRDEFDFHHNLFLIPPIYNLSVLATFRRQCKGYIHGHSAGGTNPSLVEMMHFCKPIFAFDCSFNRFTTNNHALYFSTQEELKKLFSSSEETSLEICAQNMFRIARERYTWLEISSEYLKLCGNPDGVGGRVPSNERDQSGE